MGTALLPVDISQPKPLMASATAWRRLSGLTSCRPMTPARARAMARMPATMSAVVLFSPRTFQLATEASTGASGLLTGCGVSAAITALPLHELA